MSGSELQQYSAVAGNAVAFMVQHALKLFQVMYPNNTRDVYIYIYSVSAYMG